MHDLDRLYLEFASSLEQLVRCGVNASDVVIEDACQAAWARLVRHRHRVAEEDARGWLVRTAVREAFRLCRRELRESPADLALEDWWTDVDPPEAPEPQQLIEQRQRLASLRGLPHRQQRLVWLRALGLSYDELASHEGCTSRTVERQLARARHRLRLLDGGAGRLQSAA
jgi:RNA polymerase sigma factor (sigma-70 family)